MIQLTRAEVLEAISRGVEEAFSRWLGRYGSRVAPVSAGGGKPPRESTRKAVLLWKDVPDKNRINYNRCSIPDEGRCAAAKLCVHWQPNDPTPMYLRCCNGKLKHPRTETLCSAHAMAAKEKGIAVPEERIAIDAAICDREARRRELDRQRARDRGKFVADKKEDEKLPFGGSHAPDCPHHKGGECLCWRSDPLQNPELAED